MTPLLVQVKCVSGHKADERPASFICESTHITVEEVLDQWRQAGKTAGESQADYFKVQGSDHHQYLLKHDLKHDRWTIENRW